MQSKTSFTSINQIIPSSSVAIVAEKLNHLQDTLLFSLRSILTKVKQKLGLRSGRQPLRASTNWIRPLILLAALIILIVGGKLVLAGKSSSGKYAVKPPSKTLAFNREFSFPIRGEGGAETGMAIKYIIDKIDVADEVIIKGKKAVAVKGRDFLIFTIKVVNNENVGIEIDTRDYLRISAGDSEERLAADIHNDPVEIQPISTKYTRIAFPVDEGQSHYRLYVGEIKGDKQTIDINL